jgi:bacillopeptidase F (M6 metalloprotease family)
MANTTFTGPVRSENGFEDITKNATTGVNTVNATYGQSIRGGVQGLTGAGAVDLTNLITELTTTGANALTLADGSISGQVKIVNMIVDGGDGTLTPVTFANGTTITFDAVAESATLVWNSTIGWVATSVQGATIA